MARTLDHLGSIAQQQGDRAKARAFYERSITSWEGSSQPNDPDIAYPLSHFGKLLQEEGELKEAVRLYERALALRRKALGDRHPAVGESWLDLARGRVALHDLRGALDAARTGVDISRSTLPPDHSQLAGGLFLLGDVLRRHNRPEDALPYLEEAHAIWRKKPPINPRDLADLETAIATTRAQLREGLPSQGSPQSEVSRR